MRKYSSVVSFVVMFFVLLGSVVFSSSAQAKPVDLPITWDQPKMRQTGLVRAEADGSAWTFTATLADDIVIVSGPTWSPNGNGAAIEWGMWTPNGMSLEWSSPTGGGYFTVRVSGRIRKKGTGPGGGGGTPEEKDFSGTWYGLYDGPRDPLPDPCESGDCGGTVMPDGKVAPTHASVGGIGQVYDTTQNTVADSSKEYVTHGSDGNLTHTTAGGCPTIFPSDSEGGHTGPAGSNTTAYDCGPNTCVKRSGTTSTYGLPPTSENLMSMDSMSMSMMASGPEVDDGTYIQGSTMGVQPTQGPKLYLLSEEDAYGNITTYNRDENGNLLSTTDWRGHTTTLTYDENGRVSEVEDAFGRTVSYTYDSAGRVTSQTDTSGQVTSYTYDSLNRMISQTGALGTTSYGYEGTEGGDGGTTGYSAPGDPMGFAKRTIITHPDGSKEEYFYDGLGTHWHVAPEHFIEYVDATTNNNSASVPKTIWKVESIAGQPKTTEVTSPSGAKTSYEFDGDTGQLISSTNPLGNDSSVSYNSQGNPLTMTGPDGKTLTLVYDTNDQDVLQVKDPQNNVLVTYTYNDKHQVLTTTDALSHTTTNTYTSWGAIASVTDPNATTTTYHYDSTSKLLTSIDVEGSTLVAYTYDSRERVRTVTDATGMTVTYDYDNADRVIKVTYPDETFEETSYTSCCGTMGDKPAVVTDRSGRTVEYVYDAMGRVSKVIDAAGNEVEYEYDEGGNMTRLIDTKDNATRFEYNADGLVSKKIYADDTYELYTYDDAGQLLGYRDAKGNVVNYLYDVAGRVTTIDYPTLPDVTYTYDALGRVSTSTDSLGTSTYAYDTLSRVTSIDGPWDNDTISYEYDALGRRTTLGINGTTQASYAYDALDRLTGITSGSQNFGYTYNGASSQLTQLSLPGGSTTDYSYDAMQRLTGVQSLNSDETTNIANFAYTYNDRDVRTSVEKTLGTGSAQTISYTYDDIDQLTKEISGETTPLLDKEYTYDAMGNRITSSTGGTSTTYTANNLNQVTQTSVNSVDTTLSYDANGNMIASGSKQFNYDQADRLTEVVVPGEKKSEFVYDAEGRKRITKEYTWDELANGGAGGWEQSDETRFIYDGMNLVQERNADGTVKTSFVRDGNIGGILSMTNGDGTFYYHYDGNGNVVALTDSMQNIVAQYTYDAYGNLLSSSGTQAENNPFRFSSKYFDSDTGLYDYGYRHYDSSLGRWINRDPIREAGGLNLYGMVGNNPVNSVDSYGLAKIEVWFKEVKINQYHAYILITETSGINKGKQNYISFGPSLDGRCPSRKSGEYSSLLGQIKSRYGAYKPGTKDWEETREGPHRLIVNDDRPAHYWIYKLETLADVIDKAKIPYHTFGTNSNASVRTILEGAGLNPGPAPNSISAPGWSANLDIYR